MSEGEAEALDEAARMLDETRIPEGALPEVEVPIQAGPEGEDPAPTPAPAPAPARGSQAAR